MRFLVQMEVDVPHDADREEIDKLKAAERHRAQQLQGEGRWVHLWRVVGRYANVSVFDVGSHEELHELLTTLPMWPFLAVTVTPLTGHPSALEPS